MTESKDSNVIFVGDKPFMTYVTSIVMQFTTTDKKEVVVKSRGKLNSKTIDICLVAKERFLENGIEVTEVNIESEIFKNREDKDVRVSSMEIVLKKKS